MSCTALLIKYFFNTSRLLLVKINVYSMYAAFSNKRNLVLYSTETTS